jgi:hypothetical protein
MEKFRVNSTIVGVLFIIATAAGIASVAISGTIIDSPDYLTQMAANESAVLAGAFLTFLMSIACAGVGLGLYPIIRKYSHGLAIGTVGFRLIESVTQIIVGLNAIILLVLSQEFVTASSSDTLFFETIGTIIKSGNEWLSNGVMLITWCLGAFMYYSVFFRYRLIPRWISVWGLIGITLTILSSVLVMLNIIPGFGIIQRIANGPIALQEMVFAFWLIVKGIDVSETIHNKA